MIEAIRLGDLSQRLGATLHGNPDLLITGVAPLDSAQPGHLSFLANPKYRDQLRSTQAGAVIVPAAGDAAERSWLVAENPYLVFTEAVKLFAPPIPVPPPGVHPLAWVDPAARVGAAAAIGPFCVVGANAEIGDRTVLSAQVFVGEGTVIGADSVLYPGTVVRERVRIGNRVILHPGVVIGGDGFGFAPAAGVYHKIPQIGTVVIEDDVEIGANTTVDRAALGETRIGRGAKLDNLIMVAHNVVIGAHTVIAAQVGISGSTQVGDHVMIGGQAGFGGHLRVGDQAVIGAQAGVTQSVDAKTFVSGYPARPHAQATRQLAAVARLPELQKKVRDLEARLANLEKP